MVLVKKFLFSLVGVVLLLELFSAFGLAAKTYAVAGTPVMPINRKVMVITFDPWVTLPPSQQSLVQYKGYYAPHTAALDLISKMNSNSHGKVNYSIVTGDDVTLRFFPEKTINGNTPYIFSVSDYFNCLDTGGTWDPIKCNSNANYNKLLTDYAGDICAKANSGEIDELWLYGGSWFGFPESNLTGPNAFWYNSGPTTGTTCNKLLTIMGFTYTVFDQTNSLADATHNWTHRLEATLSKYYNYPNIETDPPFPITNSEGNFMATHFWYDGSSFTNSYYGCGTSHFPPNTLVEAVFNSTTTAPSICNAFYNYPNLGDPNTVKQNISCTAWGCDPNFFAGELNFVTWYELHIPSFAGMANGTPWLIAGFPIPTDFVSPVTVFKWPDGKYRTNVYKSNRYWGYDLTFQAGTETVTAATAITTNTLANAFAGITGQGTAWAGHPIYTDYTDAVSTFVMPDGVLRTNIFRGDRYWAYNCTFQAGGHTVTGCSAQTTKSLTEMYGGITGQGTAWAGHPVDYTGVDSVSTFFLADGVTLRTNIYRGNRYWAYNCTFTPGTETITGCAAWTTNDLTGSFAGITGQGTAWAGHPIFTDYVDSASTYIMPDGVLRTNIFRGNRYWAYNCVLGGSCSAVTTKALIESFSGIGPESSLNDWWQYLIVPSTLFGSLPQAQAKLLINNSVTSLTVARNINFSLNWNSEFASYCTASNAWSDIQNSSGYTTLSKSTAGTYVYTLTCGNSAVSSVTVTVQ